MNTETHFAADAETGEIVGSEEVQAQSSSSNVVMQPEQDYYAECCSVECGWEGLWSQCKAVGAIEPLCPRCGEITEPRQCD